MVGSSEIADKKIHQWTSHRNHDDLLPSLGGVQLLLLRGFAGTVVENLVRLALQCFPHSKLGVEASGTPASGVIAIAVDGAAKFLFQKLG